MMMRKERVTIRLDANQMQCLRELKTKLKVSYSLMIRSIICDFLTKYEDNLERIIDGNEDEEYEFE